MLELKEGVTTIEIPNEEKLFVIDRKKIVSIEIYPDQKPSNRHLVKVYVVKIVTEKENYFVNNETYNDAKLLVKKLLNWSDEDVKGIRGFENIIDKEEENV